MQPFIFADSIAPRFGIAMPTVGSGAHIEPTITASLSAGAKNKGTAQDSTAATITGLSAKPRRIAARLTAQIEDVASFGNDTFESALRQNARAKLSDEYDNQCINGDGSAPNVEGLIAQLNNPTNPSAAATFDLAISAAASAIEGLWASTLKDVRMAVNPETFRLLTGLYRTNQSSESAAAHLADQLGSFFTNKRMPAKSGNVAKAILYRAGRPGLRTAAHPTWGQITVDDIYSDASSGQRHFTISVLVGDQVLLVQEDAYHIAELKIS